MAGLKRALTAGPARSTTQLIRRSGRFWQRWLHGHGPWRAPTGGARLLTLDEDNPHVLADRQQLACSQQGPGEPARWRLCSGGRRESCLDCLQEPPASTAERPASSLCTHKWVGLCQVQALTSATRQPADFIPIPCRLLQ